MYCEVCICTTCVYLQFAMQFFAMRREEMGKMGFTCLYCSIDWNLPSSTEARPHRDKHSAINCVSGVLSLVMHCAFFCFLIAPI